MTRPNRVREYDSYVVQVIEKVSVRKFLEEYKIESLKLPKIYSTPTCGVNIAGQTWIYKTGESEIELSSWILVSKTETKRVIRHEIAHILKAIGNLPGASHGKIFTDVLKVVSPVYWKKDRHWYQSPKIDLARKIHHPRLKELGVDRPEH